MFLFVCFLNLKFKFNRASSVFICSIWQPYYKIGLSHSPFVPELVIISDGHVAVGPKGLPVLPSGHGPGINTALSCCSLPPVPRPPGPRGTVPPAPGSCRGSMLSGPHTHLRSLRSSLEGSTALGPHPSKSPDVSVCKSSKTDFKRTRELWVLVEMWAKHFLLSSSC